MAKWDGRPIPCGPSFPVIPIPVYVVNVLDTKIKGVSYDYYFPSRILSFGATGGTLVLKAVIFIAGFRDELCLERRLLTVVTDRTKRTRSNGI